MDNIKTIVFGMLIVFSSSKVLGLEFPMAEVETKDKELEKLTDNYTKVPSSFDVVNHVNSKVSPPQKDCVPKIEVKPKTQSAPSRHHKDPMCKFYRKFVLMGVPADALKQALTYLEQNKGNFPKDNLVSIADYSQRSTEKRFYLLDLKRGRIKKHKVSHGSGKVKDVRYGDATIKKGKVVTKSNHNGYMKRCRIPKDKVPSNSHDQWALTRSGFFKTKEFYFSSAHDIKKKGKKGWPQYFGAGTEILYNGMKMEGLVKGVNDKAEAQGVVMHEANYNTGDVMGRSFGCPAFQPRDGRFIMNEIKGGSLYYSYTPIAGCKEDYDKVLKTVPGWETKCE